MRIAIITSLAIAVLAGCTGHQYEPREPGVSISGKAGIGVTYRDGQVSPKQSTELTISVGGSI